MNDLWTIDASGGTPTVLIGGPKNEFDPFWLLDGSRIAFTVFDFRTASGPYRGRLVSVLPDGAGREDLAPVVEHDPVLSPDGRYVAWGGAGTDGITLLDRSTGVAKVLGADGATDLIWSPDGRAILAWEPERNAAVVVAVPSGVLTRFIQPNVESVVAWTPDGASVIFSGPESESTPTWIAPATGGAATPAPPDADLARPTWWSPDASWIAGRGSKGAAFDLRPVPGGDPAPLAPGLRLLTGPPSWDSGSDAFAFAGSTLDELGDRKSAIYVVAVDGRVVRITTGPYDTDAAWEPGG